MKKYKIAFAFFILLGIFYSCQKKLVHKIHPGFVGRWKHVESNNEKWYIDIGKNSSGAVILYDSLGDFITAYGENPHRWRINESKNTLYFDFFDKFHIDTYPTEATSDIFEGLDTIKKGQKYLVLDANYFVEY